MGLRFDSPFINTRIGIERNDFWKLLNNLEYYMHNSPSIEPFGKFKDVDFVGWECRTKFPILWYDDIMIHGFHYSSTQNMLESWERRRKRFHFDNVVVVKCLYDKDDVTKFRQLPFKKKLGFYPYDIQDDNIITIQFPDNVEDYPYAYQYASVIWDDLVSGHFFKRINIFKFLNGIEDFIL